MVDRTAETSGVKIWEIEDPLRLTPEEGRRLSRMLKKTNFADKVVLPEIPRPGEPSYDLLEEIKTVHHVYAANREADEAWMRGMESTDLREFDKAKHRLASINAQVRQYESGLAEARATICLPENLAVLDTIRENYAAADRQFAGSGGRLGNSEAETIERVAYRILGFPGTQFCLDLDKTLTESDDYLRFLPHARQFENYMARNGRDESLPFVMARYAKDAVILLESQYERIGSTLKLRPGVREFFHDTKLAGIHLSIISANFRVIVISCLKQIPAEDRTHLLEITGLRPTDITAVDKEVTVAQRVKTNPGLANFLGIDGLSDQGCLTGIAAGISAGIFVLAGTRFVNTVAQTGQPYFEFRDFHQVSDIFKRILVKRDQLRQQFAESGL